MTLGKTGSSRPSKSRPRLVALEPREVPAAAFALAGSTLLAFDTSIPTVTKTTAVTGVNAGETLVGIDFRPQNGVLYGLGVDASANTGTLYAISVRTGFAAAVGSPGSVQLTTDGVNKVDLPDPATLGYGFDFNPEADRIRVVTGALNFRINPNTGLAIDGDNGGAAVSGTNPDGPIAGGTTSVDGAAYTNDQPNTDVTTLYTLDAVTDSLYLQNPPNAGTQTLGIGVTLGGNPLNFTTVGGFDIPAGVNAAVSNAAVTTGSGFAVLSVGGTTGLYEINLVNGTATLVGTVGAGTTAVQGLAVQSDLGGAPAIGLSANGTNLLRFNTGTPGTSTTVTVGTIVAGETLVGIDFRPQTGQLYGLGIDDTTDTGTLYLIDPQTGGVTIIGTASQVALNKTDGSKFELSAPGIGYGFAFNPAGDRIRVTAGDGLNFRVNPNTGAAVDADTVAPGTQPDTGINGGATGAVGAAYTNSFGRDLTVQGPTTLYTLDDLTDKLFIQNPPSNGTATAGVAVTLNGAPLDFSGTTGFDIPASVAVTTDNARAIGRGLAALTVGGVSNLYSIDLGTGAAILLGPVPTDLGGLTLGDVPTPLAATRVGEKEFAAGQDAGGDSATLYNADGTVRYTVVPFTGFTGGVRTATGDVNGDGVADLIAGTGPGMAATVKVFDGVSKAELFSTTAFEAAFTGGVFVSSGDVNGDGRAEVVWSADVTGGPRVRVFSGVGFTQLADFFGIADPNFRGGARTAVGDMNADGKGDLIVAAGFGGGPRIAAFDGAQLTSTGGPKLFGDFFAFETTLRNGAFVASGDINGDGFADLVAGGGPGGGPRVFAIGGRSLVQNGSGTLPQIANFFAGDVNSRHGIRVAVKDLDGDARADLVVGVGPTVGSTVTSYLATALIANPGAPASDLNFDAFTGFTGGVFVG